MSARQRLRDWWRGYSDADVRTAQAKIDIARMLALPGQITPMTSREMAALRECDSRPMLNHLSEMIELKRRAARARCRIKTWRLTHAEMWRLAHLLCGSRSPLDIYEEMKAGRGRVLGAAVVRR